MPVRAIQIRSPAKLNLFLEVLGKRDDGYHELETVMIRTDLHDVIRFQHRANPEISLRTTAGSCFTADRQQPPVLMENQFPLDETNLIVRAARRLQERSGTDQGADVVIHKCIPMQAGLGGGSGNAAATLSALNRLWNLNMDSEELHEIAAELGSDVNFLLSGFALGLCGGRGERVTAVPLAGPLHAVVVVPEAGNLTADVFRRLSRAGQLRSSVPLRTALGDGNRRAIEAGLFNRLQEQAADGNPAMVAAMELLQRKADGHVLMTGSGSACFCLTSTARQARLIARRIMAWRGDRTRRREWMDMAVSPPSARRAGLLVCPLRLG